MSVSAFPGRIIRFSALFALAVGLGACNDDMSELDAYITEVKARAPAPIEPIPEVKPYVRFIYPGNEADPFDSKILAPDKAPSNAGGVKPDLNRVHEFLEGFPLDSLRMVGTVYQGKELWALVRIPDGAVHRVRAGNYMGKNDGKITKVEERRVVLNELVENGFGGYKEQENSIALADKVEDKK